jgi:hypothetical protein
MNENPRIAQAETWLAEWRDIGGGITITKEGNLDTWRWVRTEDQRDIGRRAALAEIAERLLTALIKEPDLIGTIRVIVSTRAGQMAGHGLRGMGYTQDQHGKWHKGNKA